MLKFANFENGGIGIPRDIMHVLLNILLISLQYGVNAGLAVSGCKKSCHTILDLKKSDKM